MSIIRQSETGTDNLAVAVNIAESAGVCCEMCGLYDIRFVSGGKYICLTCGLLPS
jgi:hypothetical protein